MLKKLNNPKTYALVTGVVLFLLGLLGFVFRSSTSLGSGYLLFSLIFGLWGIIVSFKL